MKRNECRFPHGGAVATEPPSVFAVPVSRAVSYARVVYQGTKANVRTGARTEAKTILAWPRLPFLPPFPAAPATSWVLRMRSFWLPPGPPFPQLCLQAIIHPPGRSSVPLWSATDDNVAHTAGPPVSTHPLLPLRPSPFLSRPQHPLRCPFLFPPASQPPLPHLLIKVIQAPSPLDAVLPLNLCCGRRSVQKGSPVPHIHGACSPIF